MKDYQSQKKFVEKVEKFKELNLRKYFQEKYKLICTLMGDNIMKEILKKKA
jgi:hypothetical protein